MKIFFIFSQDLRIRLTDLWAVFLIFIAPLVIISLTALSLSPKQNTGNISTLVIKNQDASINSADFHQAALNMAQPLVIKELANNEDAVSADIELTTLTLPANFSDNLLTPNGLTSQLKVNVNYGNNSLINSATIGAYIKQLIVIIHQNSHQTVNYQLLQSVEPQKNNAMSLTYFAPSLMIFFLMYSAFSGARTILKERQSGLLDRLLYMPISVTSILLGKVLAVFVVALLQILILIVSSSLLLGVDWGASYGGLILISLALSAAFTSLGVFIAIFTKDINKANMLGMGCLLIFSCLGGNFVPVVNFPSWVQTISFLSINRWGLDGLLDLTLRQQPISGVLVESSMLMCFSFIFISLSLWRFTRQTSR